MLLLLLLLLLLALLLLHSEGELNDVQLLDMAHGAGHHEVDGVEVNEAERVWGGAEQAAKAVRWIWGLLF